MEKLELEKVAVSKDMICDISNLVGNIIEEQEFLEGVFYLAEGRNERELTISIVYIYNYFLHSLLSPVHQEMVKLMEDKYGIFIREEEYHYEDFIDERRKSYRYDYPIEPMLGVGEIIYDSRGLLGELKTNIMMDDSIDASRMRTCCQIEPPISYIKKK